jgi:hypothetical protein
VRTALAIGLLVLGGALAPGASGERSSSCGSIAAAGARYTVRIERGHPSCATAKSVLRAFIMTGRPPRAWACFRGHSGNAWAAACASGRAIVRAYARG